MTAIAPLAPGAPAPPAHDESRRDGAAPAPPPARPPSGRAAIAFIFITVLLDIMALGMVTPVLPKLVAEFLQGDAARSAIAYGLFNAAFASLQFLFSPFMGALSDRFGRRPIILASNLGLGLSYALMAFAPTLRWLFIGRAISGVTGASYGPAAAYISDSTNLETRANAFGILGAAFGLGFILGPAIGGFLGEFSSRLPLWVAGGFSVANAVYGLFVLPESLPKTLRTPFRWSNANPVGALRLLRRHVDLQALAAVAFISTLAQVSLPSTVTIYAMYRYKWTPHTVGVTLALVGVAMVVVQAGVVGRVVRAFGNRLTLIAGLCFGSVGLCYAGFAPNGTMFLLGIPLIALWSLFGAASQTLMSRHVSASEQGQLQGAAASLMGIAELIGPLIFPFTFAYFVSPGHPVGASGTVFVLAGALLAANALFAFLATRNEADVEDDACAAVCEVHGAGARPEDCADTCRDECPDECSDAYLEDRPEDRREDRLAERPIEPPTERDVGLHIKGPPPCPPDPWPGAGRGPGA